MDKSRTVRGFPTGSMVRVINEYQPVCRDAIHPRAHIQAHIHVHMHTHTHVHTHVHTEHAGAAMVKRVSSWRRLSELFNCEVCFDLGFLHQKNEATPYLCYKSLNDSDILNEPPEIAEMDDSVAALAVSRAEAIVIAGFADADVHGGATLREVVANAKGDEALADFLIDNKVFEKYLANQVSWAPTAFLGIDTSKTFVSYRDAKKVKCVGSVLWAGGLPAFPG